MAATMRMQAFTSGTAAVRPVATRRLVVSASYKNGENIDLSRVAAYKRTKKDCGSPEVQVATLTARVEQISKHLSTNKKDFAAKRGLVAILSQRKSLLQYLFRENRDAYDQLIKDFGIRGVVVNDTRGASRQKDAL